LWDEKVELQEEAVLERRQMNEGHWRRLD